MANLRIFLRKGLREFPWHLVLALLVALDGYLFLLPVWAEVPRDTLFNALLSRDGQSIAVYLQSGGAAHLARIVLGIGVQVMAIGLLVRARLAWSISLLFLLVISIYYLLHHVNSAGFLVYTLVLIGLLIAFRQRFNRSSIAAGGLFAFIGIAGLFIYAVSGSLYLGKEFSPSIDDPLDALYFSVVTMSTVGYGDIRPAGDSARLFTLSIIILGITIFATTLSAAIGPLISNSLNRLMNRHMTHAMRKNHIILAGAGPMATALYQALKQRSLDVCVIISATDTNYFPKDADLLIGDATESPILEQADAKHARHLLALSNDDAENAFIILAAREVCGPSTKLVALVNSPVHLDKIRRLNPDLVISLQALGSEILARTLNGEPVNEELVTRLLFGQGNHIA